MELMRPIGMTLNQIDRHITETMALKQGKQVVHVNVGDEVAMSDGTKAHITRSMTLKQATQVRNVRDWMLLIDEHKICLVPPGERDPDTGRDKMPPMRWAAPDDDARLRAMLAMIGNQQEIEEFLPDIYVRGIDEM